MLWGMKIMSKYQIYTKNEKFTIFADSSTWKYYIQMAGKEIEPEGFDTAAKAIEEACGR